MKPTTEATQKSPIHALVDEVFGPVHAESGSARHRLLQARSVLAYVGLVGTLVQIVVWLMVGVITADLDAPWWLWTTVPAAIGVAVLTVADRWHGWFAGTDTHTHNNSAEVNR